MQIDGAVALVTGTNRGIGRRLAEQLVARGANVYATARRPEAVDIEGVHVLALDITDAASVAAAAQAVPDLSLLVNNAGTASRAHLVTGDLDEIRAEMETHFFGTLNVIRAFAGTLGAQGGGAIVNVMSALSWVGSDVAGAYAAAKAAEWSLTNTVRLELAAQGTMVTGVHLGAAATDMMAGYDGPMLAPSDVASATLDAVEKGQLEVLLDGAAEATKAAAGTDPKLVYPQAASH
jgi:NAD(P)-dependent dehydrogenase (short-subunit alcohol dehydrogenase family)